MRRHLHELSRILNPFASEGGYLLPHVTVVLCALLLAFSAGWIGGTHHEAEKGGLRTGPIPGVRLHERLSGSAAAFSLDRYVVRIHDQGNAESCVGQTFAEIEEIENREAGRHISFSSSFIWNLVNGGIDQGVSYSDALTALARYGDVSLKAFPYDGQSWTAPYYPPAWVRVKGKPYRAFTWRVIGLSDTQTIKAELLRGHVLALSLPWNDGLYNNWGTGVAWSNGGSFHFWHSTAIVGFNPLGVEILNSWGPSWGINGRLTITWSLLAQYAGASAIVDPNVNFALHPKPPAPPRPRPTPTPKPRHRYIFPVKRFEQYRTTHHLKPVPYKEHGKYTWAASIWSHNQRIGGIKSSGHFVHGHPGYNRYPFRYAVVYAWPKTHRIRIVRHR